MTFCLLNLKFQIGRSVAQKKKKPTKLTLMFFFENRSKWVKEKTAKHKATDEIEQFFRLV